MGLVTAHIVAGTGFFSDLSASFTDVFGGRSATYQSQLASIEKEAFQALLDRAVERAANWIVGVRVDFDEISGKGVQMFMVSAQGTAVQARRLPKATEAREVNSLSGKVVQKQLRKAALLRQLPKLASGESEWSEAVLQDILDAEVHEALPLILGILLQDAREADRPFSQAVRSLAMQAFRAAPRRVTRDIIHNHLLDGNGDRRLLALYGKLNLLSLGWVLEQLTSPEWERRRIGLQALCAGVAATYSSEDMSLLEQIRDTLAAAFPDCSKVVEIKGLLGSGTRWRCRNGHDNQMDITYCHVCSESRLGLRRDERGPERGLEIVETTLEMLKQCIL